MRIIALIALAMPLFGQTIGFTTGMVNHHNMGFSPVAPMVGVDVYSSHVIAHTWLSSADKYIGNGTTAWAEGYAVLGRKWYGGPGILVRHTWTSQWRKTSPYPSFIAGLRSPTGVEASVAVHLRDWQTQNHGRGANLRIGYVFPINHRWAFATSGQLTVLKFSDGLSQQLIGSVLSVNLGLRFSNARE